MARIQTYGLDTVDTNDKLLGTDSGGATKNFSIDEISKFFKNVNAGGTSGQFNYQYIRNSGAIGKGHMHILAGSDTINFSTVTTLKVSKYIQGDTINTVQNYLTSEFVGNDIIIADTLIPNNYGVYGVTSVTVDANNNNFYDLVLSYKSGNGNLTDGQFYSIILYTGEATGDKSFTHTQNAESNSWTINHGLNKKPSVTVTTAATDTVVIGEVTYTNNNTLVVSFEASFSGIAYLN